ncbi:hypothetical protein SEA_WEASELS2_228 [Rhodococcus phage Weasels2]|uniref:Uncharacterized protein n=1 Tax=Rhodococcus phage Weasels2 TaxID=1897437 RepID=A0A1I9SAK0_9CAUD|nr:hypothetical protein FDH04_gp188 [Rhodococcus phage Weasels2]AOZ63806.1 hypothetical protein SEA_WEASELS2_228 [Rhodococcus phage Weasels2]
MNNEVHLLIGTEKASLMTICIYAYADYAKAKVDLEDLVFNGLGTISYTILSKKVVK